jgi:hypothetical protein
MTLGLSLRSSQIDGDGAWRSGVKLAVSIAELPELGESRLAGQFARR